MQLNLSPLDQSVNSRGSISTMWFLWIILFVAIACYMVVQLWAVQTYWKKRGVVHTKSWPILGDFSSVFWKKISMPDNVVQIYKKFPNEKYFGINQFMMPVLVITDLELIKQMCVKDFEHFHDHRNFTDPENEPLFGKNLFSLKGKDWREMRATLSPAFSSSKMKNMFILMSDCAENFANHFLTLGKDTIVLEMKDTFTRFANDLIASTAFGIKCDSLAEPKNEFYMMGKELTNFTFLQNFVIFFSGMCPNVIKFLKLSVFSKKVGNFFRRIVKETMDTREKNNIVRHDMINLLMEARKGKLKHETKDDESVGFATVEESNIGIEHEKLKKELTDDDLTAQALIFFFGGFETTSTNMCFMAHELAVNPDIQKKLQDEIDETWKKCNGKLTYDALTKMKYLDMVLSETMRKWPPGFASDRICTKPYTIPGDKPLLIEEGTSIMLPWFGIQKDPKYFPDPEKFDPERFSEENKDYILPGSYNPFGIGPRNCIGSRFALLENKTMFFHLLAKFDIVVVEKTQIPLKLNKSQFNLLAEKGFWLGLKARQNNK